MFGKEENPLEQGFNRENGNFRSGASMWNLTLFKDTDSDRSQQSAQQADARDP